MNSNMANLLGRLDYPCDFARGRRMRKVLVCSSEKQRKKQYAITIYRESCSIDHKLAMTKYTLTKEIKTNIGLSSFAGPKIIKILLRDIVRLSPGYNWRI